MTSVLDHDGLDMTEHAELLDSVRELEKHITDLQHTVSRSRQGKRQLMDIQMELYAYVDLLENKLTPERLNWHLDNIIIDRCYDVIHPFCHSKV